jgi:hypothetical protein
MFRGLMVTSAALLGLAGTLALPSQAQADARVRVGWRGGSVTVGVWDRPLPPPPPVYVSPPVRVYRPVVAVPVVAHYHVMYRTCSHEPWCEYGRYDCHHEAHRVERRLERRGFQARVVHH